MPVTDNDICCALAQSARSPDTYRQAVLELLYGIGTGGGGGGSEGMSISAGVSSAFLSSLVFSNSNGVSFGLNGSTLTGSVVAPEVKDIVIGGNTSGTTAVINSGTMTLAGGNNITLSQSGNAITISGGQSQQTQNIIRDAIISGNTSGVTANISSGTLVLIGGDNVTLSQAGNSITISGASQSVQTQSNQAISAANGSFTFQTASFADSNGVSFSTGTQGLFATVKTDYLTAQSVQTQSRFNEQIGGNTSGTTALISSGVLTLAGGNNITLSQNGNAITISAASQTVQTQNLFDAQIDGNTTGTTALISSGTMTLAGGNNITLSQNGNAITISAAGAAGQTVSGAYFGIFGTNTRVDNSLTVAPIVFPISATAPVSGSVIRIPGFVSIQTSANNTQTLSGQTTMSFAFYTRNVSSLSMATSGSQAFSYSNTSNANTDSYGAGGAVEVLFDIPMNFLIPTSLDVYAAFMLSTGGTSAGVSFAVQTGQVGLPAQTWGGVTASPNKVAYPFFGKFSTTTGAFPSSIGLSEFAQAGNGFQHQSILFMALNSS